MKRKPKKRVIRRSAVTGRFVSAAVAKRRPKTTVVETVSNYRARRFRANKGEDR